MGLDEAEEYRRASQRFVKQNLGMWAGREVLPWYYRVPLAPLYGLYFTYICLKGVPINLQILREQDYEPDRDPDGEQRLKCPQCTEPLHRDIDIQFSVGENDTKK